MTTPSQKSFPATVVMPIPVEPFITHINDRKRFLMLVAGIFTATAIASHYTFSLISDYLKNRYHYGQADLTVISTVGSSIGALTFPSGVVFDYFGASIAVAIPCIVGTIGFLLMGLAFASYIEGSVMLFSIFYAIICIGVSSMDTGSLMTNLLNFPRDRGAVVIIQKTFNGLGSSIIAVWFTSFFLNDYSSWAFFTSGIVFVFGMTGAAFLRLPPYHLTNMQRKKLTEDEIISREVTRDIYMTQRPSKRRLLLGYIILFILITFLTAESLVMAYYDVSQKIRIIFGSITTVIFASITLIALPLRCLDDSETNMECIPSMDTTTINNNNNNNNNNIKEKNVFQQQQQQQQEEEEEQERPRESGRMTDSLLQPRISQRRSYASTLPGPPPEKIPEPQYQGTFFANFLFLDLWLLFWTGFSNWGAGNVVAANTAQIYRSINNDNYVNTTNSLYVTLMGVGSALGRVTVGYIEIIIDKRSYASFEEIQQRTYLLPRTKSKLHIIMVYPLTSILMSIGVGILLFIPPEGLVVPLVVISFALGFGAASTALVIRSIFAKDVGKHYSFLFTASFIANIALNRFMFGELFDREGKKMGLYPFCSGRICVQTSFIVLLGLNITAIITSLCVCWRFLRYAAQQIQAPLLDYDDDDDDGDNLQ